LKGVDDETVIPQICVDRVGLDLEKSAEDLRIADEMYVVGVPAAAEFSNLPRMGGSMAENADKLHTKLRLGTKPVTPNGNPQLVLVCAWQNQSEFKVGEKPRRNFFEVRTKAVNVGAKIEEFPPRSSQSQMVE
jgi:hypothetical protein